MWINKETDENFNEYENVETYVDDKLDDEDEFENYLLDNNFEGYAAELAARGRTQYGGYIITNFEQLVCEFRDGLQSELWNEWEYFEPDAECLQYESDD